MEYSKGSGRKMENYYANVAACVVQCLYHVAVETVSGEGRWVT